MAYISAAVQEGRRKAEYTRERNQLEKFFQQIQVAAFDGQNGSCAYASDRLALIQALATTALTKLE